MKYKLGINVDHIATLRNARNEGYPNVLDLAKIAIDSGAEIITAHLREDRRHIKDKDIIDIKKNISVPLNLEIAPTSEMLEIAKSIKPESVCLVPEKREEITTEGGLNIADNFDNIYKITSQLKEHNIKVSLFIDPNYQDVELVYRIKPDSIEINTGKYSNLCFKEQYENSLTISKCAIMAHNLGINVHAGHGLNIQNVNHIAKIIEITEFHIGHFLVSYALFVGFKESVHRMKKEIELSRLQKW